MNKYSPLPGDIIIGAGHNFTDKLQYFFNGSGASHGCVITYPNGANHGIPMILSAEYNGVVHVLWDKFMDDPTYNVWVYRIKGAGPEQVANALDFCEKEFLNDKYAYLSWPWFGYKSLWDHVLNPALRFLHLPQYNISKQHNWYFKDCFCTEHVYYFMLQIVNSDPVRFKNLHILLSPFFPDTFQPQDLKQMAIRNPDIFELQYSR